MPDLTVPVSGGMDARYIDPRDEALIKTNARIMDLERALNIIASGFKGDKVLAEWEMSNIAAAAVGVK